MPLKIGKRARSEAVNPFRPNYGLPNKRNYTVCRISDLSDKLTLLDCHEHLPVRVDCDAEELFIREMTHVIPKSEIWHDKELEVYQVALKHLEWVIDTATDYFDSVKLESGGKVEEIKSPTRKDLINKDGSPFTR